MKQHVRLTQKDLVFGLYWGRDGKENSGLHIWFRGSYIWPRPEKAKPSKPKKRAPRKKAEKYDPAKDTRNQPLPFDGEAGSATVAATSLPEGTKAD